MELITQSELAKILGVDRSYISKLAKKGIFSHCFEGKKLKKDCALEAYYKSRNLRRESQRRSNTKKKLLAQGMNSKELEEMLNSEPLSVMQKVQLQKDYWAAKLNELKYDVERKRLYTREEIDKKAENILVAFRNKTLALPTKVAPTLIGLEDIAEIKSILDNAVYELLEELSRLEDITDDLE